jgi:hypothetical protein
MRLNFIVNKFGSAYCLDRLAKYLLIKDGCWLWTATKDKDNYGKLCFSLRPRRKAMVIASRLMLFLFKPFDESLQVLHTCDNPQCCNPHHLFAGTSKENTQDAFNKGRRRILSAEERNSTKVTREQVESIRIEYKSGGITQKELALKYKLTQGGISNIVNGNYWK